MKHFYPWNIIYLYIFLNSLSYASSKSKGILNCSYCSVGTTLVINDHLGLGAVLSHYPCKKNNQWHREWQLFPWFQHYGTTHLKSVSNKHCYLRSPTSDCKKKYMFCFLEVLKWSYFCYFFITNVFYLLMFYVRQMNF